MLVSNFNFSKKGIRMPEELQNLLDRIQKDGVDKAEAKSKEIISNAENKASEIIKNAGSEAAKIIEKAGNDASALQRNGEKSLQQASRDVLLSLAATINSSLQQLITTEVHKALEVKTIQDMLVKMIESYSSGKEGHIEVLLNERQQKEVSDYFISKYSEAMKKGLEIKASGSVISGFKVSMQNNKLEHDFSGEALTDAFCRFLRPKIAEIVKSGQNK